MIRRFLCLVPLFACLLGAQAFGQGTGATPKPRHLADILEQAGDLQNPANRERAVTEIRAAQEERRAAGRARAQALGLPLRLETRDGRVREVAGVDDDGEVVYFTTQNANAAISSGADVLLAAPYAVNGSSVTIGLWDAGSARTTHQEFGGRIVVKDGAATAYHSTAVAGTLAAAGVVSAARGMAPAATIDSYDWNNDKTEMTARGATAANQAGRIYLSNHSYGYISGWDYGGDGVWTWYGTGTTATGAETKFGQYNSFARDSDALAYSAPYYLMFRAAGNDRNDNPWTGATAKLTSTATTTVTYDPALHPAGDGNYRGGYDTISFDAIAKNVVTVGAVNDAVTRGSRDLSGATMLSFSCFGPTDDGRIKPDLVANGYALYTPSDSGDNTYTSISGTSLSTPSAAGSAALLVQLYANLFSGGAMRAATLKGLLIHTADDLGTPGPDYQFGWGLINVAAAGELLRDFAARPLTMRLQEQQLTSTIKSRTHEFVWDGTSPIRATLSWTDPAGTATTNNDSPTARLVNNLDLKIIGPNGVTYLPYVMPFAASPSVATMSLPATTGVNNTDNVEQVYLSAPPAAGVYRVIVSCPGTLKNNLQDYSLLISGSANTAPPPAALTLSTVTPTTAYALSGITIDLTGTGLSAVTSVKLTRAGRADIVATALQPLGDGLRCTFNLTGAAGGAWNIVASSATTTATLPNAFNITGVLWSEFFDGTISGWNSTSITGTNSWATTTALALSSPRSYFAAGPASKTTTALVSPAIAIPASATGLQLRFWHRFSLQSGQDGGRLEYSINGGAWTGAGESGSGTTFASNGYSTTKISATGSTSNQSDFAGLSAWTGATSGFVETALNLTDTARFAGQSVRFRWVLATNSSQVSTGWWIDNIVLLGDANFANQPPVITVGPSTTSTETVTADDGTVLQVLRDDAASVSVTATDDAGANALVYSWSASGPSGAPAVVFTATGTNAARETIAQFGRIGDYTLSVAATDTGGLTASGTVHVRVLGTLGAIVVTPSDITLTVGQSFQLTATALDQFADPLTPQPTDFLWRTNGGGSITSTGFFTATTPGYFGASAEIGVFNDVAGVTIVAASNLPSFTTWASGYGLVGDAATGTADPDGDGLANLVEFALGGDPTQRDGAQRLPTITATDSYLELSFNRSAQSVNGADVWVETSRDLTTWLDFAQLSPNQIGAVTVRVPVTDTAPLFVRLRVVQK